MEHVARDLRLHGVHVVHQPRRAQDRSQVDERGEKEDDQLAAT
jgi:hypothetical protein